MKICQKNTLVDLRDNHGFKGKKLKKAKDIIKEKHTHDSIQDVLNSIYSDNMLYVDMMHSGSDPILDIINEDNVRLKSKKAPIYVHAIHREFVVVQYMKDGEPAGGLYPYALKDIDVGDVNMDSYMKSGFPYEIHKSNMEIEAAEAAREADKERIETERAYFEEREDSNRILRNEPNGESAAEYEGEQVLGSDKVNRIDDILALADDLDAMDNVGTSDEHKSHLRNVIKVLFGNKRKPIEEMNVYLNKKGRSNGGIADFKDRDIKLTLGSRNKMFGNDMSMIETFVHELIHGGSHFSMNFKQAAVAKQVALLKKLRAKALDGIKPEDLLGDVVINREAELEIAKERIKYMTGNLEEFLAYALTHEKMFNRIKDIRIRDKRNNNSLLDAILNTLNDMIDAAFKAFTGKERKQSMQGDVLIMQLVSEIGAVNQNIKKSRQDSLIGKLDTKVDEYEERLTEWFDKQEEDFVKKMIDKYSDGTNTLKKLSFAEKVKIGWFMVATEEGAPLLQGFLSAIGQKPTGAVQTLIKHLKKSDNLGNRMQALTMASTNIDGDRESSAEAIGGIISSGFKRTMKKNDRLGLYNGMIMADGMAIVSKYGEDSKRLYESESELDNEITAVENAINGMVSNEGTVRLIKNQSEGLARLMLDGEGSIIQRRNPMAILQFVKEDKNKKYDELVDAVDTLASLYAIKRSDPTINAKMAEMLDKEYPGMENMAKMNDGFKSFMADTHTMDERLNMMKNYHREVYDDRYTTMTARVKDREKMKDKGYELVDYLPDNGLGANLDQLALYVSTDRIRQPFNRSAYRYTGDKQTGALLIDNVFKSKQGEEIGLTIAIQKTRAEILALKYEKAVRDGKDVSDFQETHVIPELDEEGNVIDFRTPVMTKHKLKHMGLEMNPVNSTGRSWAHEVDVKESNELNQVIWQENMKDMAENAYSDEKLGKNQFEYADIASDSSIYEVSDAAKILPKNIQDMIRKLKRLKKDIKEINKEYRRTGKLAESTIGDISYDETLDRYTISDSLAESIIDWGLSKKERESRGIWKGLSGPRKREMKKILSRGVFKVRADMILDTFGARDLSLAELLPNKKMFRHVKTMIRKIENAWKEIVKIFKVDMIIRMLPVIMGNIVSNIIYTIQMGGNPVAVVRMQKEGVEALREYLESKKRMNELMGLIVRHPNNNEKYKLELAELKDNMDRNPAKPLLDAHLYQHIVEDVGLEDFKSNSRIARWVDENTEGVPQFIKTGGNWLFLNEKTSFFQMITKATAYSDFVARYAQYHIQIQKQESRFEERNGRPMNQDEIKRMKNELVIQVRDAYVNYSKPDSRFMQYINDMGFVAFTKYLVRIQHSISDLMRMKPLRFMLAVFGQEMFEGFTGMNPDDPVESALLGGKLPYVPGFDTIVGNIIEPQGFTYAKDIYSYIGNR